jgi:hypothetical protein
MPKADTPAMSVEKKAETILRETEDNWFDPNADVSWGRLGAIALGAVVLKKYLKSRSARRAAATPAQQHPRHSPQLTQQTTLLKPRRLARLKQRKAKDPRRELTNSKREQPARRQERNRKKPRAATQTATSARRGQAQAVIDEGPSPEMDEINRKLLKLQQRDLKHREKKLDKLKFKHRTLEKEYEESPQKNKRTEELLKAWQKDINGKQENIENLRREIQDTENKLAGRPRPQAVPASRPAAATTTRTTVAEPSARPITDVVSENNNGTPVSERPAQPVRAASGNPPVVEPTVHAQNPVRVAPSPELVPPTVLEGDNSTHTAPPSNGTTTEKPAVVTQESGKPAVPTENPAPKNAAKKLSPEFHEDLDKLKRHVGHLEEPFKPGGIETMLDERDIPRLPRAEVAMDAYNESSLRKRAQSIHTEERGLRAQRDALEAKYREIEKGEAKLRSKTNVFEEETREQRTEQKKLEKLRKEYDKLEKAYDERVANHKADVESLAKDREGHTQRGADLDSQEAKLKDQTKALNEKFAAFENEKHSLPSYEYEHRWRDLAKQRVDLHAKGMTLAERRAYHQGMQFQSLSERPGTPTTVNIRGAFNQTNVTRGLGVGGIGLGGYGLYKSIEAGDTAGITVNSGNILTGGAALWQTSSAVAPKLVTFVATKLNVPMLVATGVYQIYNEKGEFIETNADGTYSLGDRGARTLAVTGTIATGVATIIAGTAAAPAVILAGGAAIVGETAIEMRHSYRAHEEVNRLNKEAAQANVTTGGLERNESGMPVIRNYSRLTVFAINYAKNTNVQDPYEHVNKTDYSDPKTLRKLEKALDKKIAELHKTITDNSSVVPDWMRIVGTDSANKKMAAESELAPLEAARRELEIFKQDVAAHKKYDTQNGDLFTSWSRANEQLREAAKGGFDAVILNGFNRDGDRNLSVDEIKAALLNGGIKSRAEIDTDHDDIISHTELENSLRRGLDGVKALAKDQFAEASTSEDNTPAGVGGSGPRVKPRK